MHASIEQLLSLRDGDADATELHTIEQHVGNCSLCRERLAGLIATRNELNRLPVHSPKRDHWPEILAAAGVGEKHDPASRGSKYFWYAGAGLAASLLLAVVVVVNTGEQPGTTSTSADSAVSGSDTASIDAAAEPPARKWTTEEIDALVARSQNLEQTLRRMPGRPSVKRASTSETIMGLQQSIALVDYQLNYGSRSMTAAQRQRLWQQRVDLMNSLVSVRYAEAQTRTAGAR